MDIFYHILCRVNPAVVYKRRPIQDNNVANPDSAVYLRVVQMRLSNARRRAGLTQEEAADLAGLPVRTYQGLEGIRDGRNFNPTLLTLRAVAQALKTTIGELSSEPTSEDLDGFKRTIKNKTARRTTKPK